MCLIIVLKNNSLFFKIIRKRIQKIKNNFLLLKIENSFKKHLLIILAFLDDCFFLK